MFEQIDTFTLIGVLYCVYVYTYAKGSPGSPKIREFYELVLYIKLIFLKH
jgi:hypothetical protein